MTNETTASQPKSIGDDAQFQNLMSSISQAMTSARYQRFHEELVKLLDSRAPAAQASATIQAAPDLQRYFNSEFGIEKFSAKQHKNMPKIETYFLASDVEALLATTIQEPVMMAEPVGDLGALREALDLAATWIENIKPEELELWRDVKSADIRRVLRAAPMVADPAGVAGFTLVAEVVNERKDDDGNPAGFQIVSSSTVDFDLEHLPHGTKLYTAATVKAVPSEALDECQVGAAAPAELLWVEVNLAAVTANKAFGQWMPERWLQEFVKAYNFEVRATKGLHAAPLADKTGGGE